MLKSEMRSEREFVTAIDCRFPLNDRAAAILLIEEGCAISSNAAFAVVDEISRPPRSARMPVEVQQALLSELWSRLDHPLLEVIRPLAERVVAEDRPTLEEALVAMREIQKYPGQYGALSIAYFSADDEGDALERAHEQVRQSWSSAD